MKTIFKVFGAFVAVLLVIGVITALVTDEEQIAEQPDSEVEASEPEELTIDKKIENAVIDAIGESNNSKKKTVEEIAFSETDKLAVIALNANENLTTELTKKGIWLNSVDIFEEIKNIDEVDSYLFQWHLPLVDTNGNEKDGLVMSFDISKTDLEQINYDNFSTDNIPNVVENYFEHTAFSE